MTKQTLKRVAVVSALLGLLLSVSSILAQGRRRIVGRTPLRHISQANPSGQVPPPGATSYSYTLLSYPGQLSTTAICINKGATTSETEIVGGYGTAPELSQAGFVARVSGTKAVTESYLSVSYPHEPAEQFAECINDSGQIVGTYIDSSGASHGYERSGGKFTPLDVPFSGATGTYPMSINNSGEVVGGWSDSDGNEHGFTLIGSTYTSFDCPGGTQTYAADINSAGDIVGDAYNASGNAIGFLLSGGTYSLIEYPSAVGTFANGINDSGVIVGSYCTTSECEMDFDGVQTFVLSAGVYAPISILPGEVSVVADDINNNGVLVGYYQDAAGLVASFVAKP
jgi:hypothetical protein